MKRGIYIGAGIALLSFGGLAITFAQSHGHMGHGSGMHNHDEATMPGLIGENASAQESAEIALMFRKFDTITREVENLPNGIHTVTRSSDVEVMDALVSHSVGMIDRVGQRDDPKIRIQSPTLDIFFMTVLLSSKPLKTPKLWPRCKPMQPKSRRWQIAAWPLSTR